MPVGMHGILFRGRIGGDNTMTMTIGTIIFGMWILGMLAYVAYRAYLTMAWTQQQQRYHDQILDFRDIALSRAKRESQIVTIFTEQGTAISDWAHPQSWQFLQPGGRVRAAAKQVSEQYEQTETPQIAAEQRRISLLDAMAGPGSFYVWGGRGSGKTYFVRALVRQKVEDEGAQVMIVDPKPQRKGKWPDGVPHIGANENFDECRELGSFLDAERARRREHYDQIERFPHLLIVVDELPILNDEIGIIDTLLPIIKFCRSFRMDVLLIAQGCTNKSHGCTGQADILRESLDFIQMKFDRRTGERYAMYESEGTDPLIMSVDVPKLPQSQATPFTPSSHVGKSHAYPHENNGVRQGKGVSRVSIPLASVSPETDTEAEIIKRYRTGQSPTKIRNDLFGKGGGNQLKKVKTILSQYGMI